MENLEKYNFTKGFFGTNGVDIKRGLTTPDLKEASVKKKAMNHCKEVYILADSSKFDQVLPVKYGDIENLVIITDRLLNKDYNNLTTIKEVF